MLTNIIDLVNFFKEEKDFVTAVQYTAARFKFSDMLVEKDFELEPTLKKHKFSDFNLTRILEQLTLLSHELLISTVEIPELF